MSHQFEAEMASNSKDKTVSSSDTPRSAAPGISIDVFRAITQLEGFRPDMTTADVTKELLMPMTLGTKDSLVDFITRGSQKQSAIPVESSSVGLSTFFVSHAWSYNFLSLYLALLRFDIEYKRGLGLTGTDASNVFYWYDAACGNQHLSPTRDHDYWTNDFRSHIRAIGKVLLVLMPWEAPVLVTRSWCLWEIYSAQEADAQLVPIFPGDAHHQLEQHLKNDPAETIEKIASIDARNAQATMEDDRVRILQAIEETVTVEKLNSRVRSEIMGILLCISAASGDSKSSNVLMEKGASLKSMSYSSTSAGAPAFLQACANGHLEIAQTLFQKEHCDPFQKSATGQSCIHVASQGGHLEVLEWLLSLKEFQDLVDIVDGDDKSSLGITPLHLACASSSHKVVQLLLEHKANPRAARRDGWQPLHVACRSGSLQCVELILKENVDVNAMTSLESAKESPLMIACRGSVALEAHDGGGYSFEISKLLIENGADVTLTNTDGRSALFFAVWGHLRGSPDLVKLLVESGSDVNGVDNAGDTVLGIAMQANNKEMVRMLKTLGAKAPPKKETKRASNRRSSEVIQRFLRFFRVSTPQSSGMQHAKTLQHAEMRLEEANVILQTLSQDEVYTITAFEPLPEVLPIVLVPLIVFGHEPSWGRAKRVFGGNSSWLINRMAFLDVSKVSKESAKQLDAYVTKHMTNNDVNDMVASIPVANAFMVWAKALVQVLRFKHSI